MAAARPRSPVRRIWGKAKCPSTTPAGGTTTAKIGDSTANVLYSVGVAAPWARPVEAPCPNGPALGGADAGGGGGPNGSAHCESNGLPPGCIRPPRQQWPATILSGGRSASEP